MIGTPCYDGKIEVWYANSLVETIKQGVAKGIEIYPIWLSYDALIQRARNDLVALMLDMDCDDIFFIDSDIEWQPEWFFKLLDYSVDVVGGTYPKKGDDEMYVVKQLDVNKIPNPSTGLLEVDGLGTGFLRVSRKAIQYLWDISSSYEEAEYNKIRRMVFEVVVQNNGLISEDIWACYKLKRGGFPIWLDTSVTCNHVGVKKYTGNFNQWLARAKSQSNQNPYIGQPTQNRYIDISNEIEKIKSLYS
jgi:glycosyltransferase involved in cell wall biosynthesis